MHKWPLLSLPVLYSITPNLARGGHHDHYSIDHHRRPLTTTELTVRDVFNIWQAEALRREGADPFIGRKLPALCIRAGLSANVGVIPFLWDDEALRAEFGTEWALMKCTMVWMGSEDELWRYKQVD